MKILGIETSCDETSAAIIEGKSTNSSFDIYLLSNIVSSQINLHAKYGGVVPEVAARAHIENIIPVIKEAFLEAKCNWDDIDVIGVTISPGLIGSLMIGLETAKFLACTKEKPIIGVNHLEGHIYANFIDKKTTDIKFPILALVVSGGHTLLVLMKDHLCYEIVGQTRDDAAGEAFDKVAKLLDLGYPGGPIISDMAKKGDNQAFKFPIIDLTPQSKRDEKGFLIKPEKSLDFSFSGLKTAVLREVRQVAGSDKQITKSQKENLAASFQKAAIDSLVINTSEAAKKYKAKMVFLAGGVAANNLLRKELGKKLKLLDENIVFGFPKPILCTDNAAMIATVGYFYALNKNFDSFDNLVVNPSLTLT